MTTNNHPAHGPVSLDRLHQISEILSKASAQSDGGNLGYAMADAVKVIDGAIAAFGAEPVAVNDDMAYAFHHALSDSSLGTDEVEEIKTGLCAAFANVTTTPSPVVHDDLLSMAASAIEDLLEHTDPSTSYYSGVWADVPGKLRAAMLQAGKSPVIPDCWIPVSERMPESIPQKHWSDDVIAISESGDIFRMAWCPSQNCWSINFQHLVSASPKIIGWMPLPAAPQQEVK
ncbi:hypothetical protein [Citrobacter freundii]